MSTATPLTDFAVEVVATSRGDVEVARVGDGPPVLLVHGTPGSWRQTTPLARVLADDHTVLLPSRPGYGATSLSSGRTPEDQAALYAALLDALGLDGLAGVVGVSGGGPSATAFAAAYPERTANLVLLCALAGHLMRVPTPMLVGAAIPPLASMVSRMNRNRSRRMLADDAAIDERIAADLTPAELERAGADPRIRQDLVDFLHSHLDAPPGLRGLANDARQMRRAHATGATPLKSVGAPTLIVHGDADPVVPLAHARYYADAIAGASLVVVPEAGHVVMLTHRDTVFPRVQAWLAGDR